MDCRLRCQLYVFKQPTKQSHSLHMSRQKMFWKKGGIFVLKIHKQVYGAIQVDLYNNVNVDSSKNIDTMVNNSNKPRWWACLTLTNVFNGEWKFFCWYLLSKLLCYMFVLQQYRSNVKQIFKQKEREVIRCNKKILCFGSDAQKFRFGRTRIILFWEGYISISSSIVATYIGWSSYE